MDDQEIELKFLGEAGTLGAIKAELPLINAVPRATRRLRTLYFDTPDHRLKRHGIFVRVRQSGSQLSQSIKQTTGVARGEWEHDLTAPTPDARLVEDKAVAAILRGNKVAPCLQPVFETEVERSSYLCRSDGAEIEVVLDEGEIKADTRRLPISELELELKQGDPAELFLLARRLIAHLPVLPSIVSKGTRGFLLAEGKWGEAQKVALPRLARGTTAIDAFRQSCLPCLQAFMQNASLFSEETRDIEIVHQSRVAIRRLRSGMSLFKPILQSAHIDILRRELKWISDLLGMARDLDVWQNETILPKARDADAHAAFALLAQHMEEKRQHAYRTLAAAISSERLRRLLLELAILLADVDPQNGEDHAGTAPIEEFLDLAFGKRVKKTARRARRLGGMDESDQHRLRIRAKKLRYMAEFFEGLAESRKQKTGFRRLVGALQAMQSSLGEIHDGVALRAYLAREFSHVDSVGARPQDVPAAYAAGCMTHEPPQDRLLRKAQRASGELDGNLCFWH